MDCINCGIGDSYTKLVICRATDEAVGGLCEACGVEIFGTVDAIHPPWQECCKCSGESDYLLASIEFILESDTGEIKEFERGDIRVGICEDHIQLRAKEQAKISEVAKFGSAARGTD